MSTCTELRAEMAELRAVALVVTLDAKAAGRDLNLIERRNLAAKAEHLAALRRRFDDVAAGDALKALLGMDAPATPARMPGLAPRPTPPQDWYA